MMRAAGPDFPRRTTAASTRKNTTQREALKLLFMVAAYELHADVRARVFN